MYPDSFTIERLALELNAELKGTSIKDIFSTSPTDLFFVFSNKKGFKIQFYQGLGLFQFPGIDKFPVKNRMQWFNTTYSQSVISVNPHLNSRSFEIVLANELRLVFKLFGKFSNVILFDSEENSQEVFCLNHQKDKQIDLKSFNYNVSNIATYTEAIGRKVISETDFSNNFNWYGADALTYLRKAGFFSSGERKSIIDSFTNQYQKGELFIIKKDSDSFGLSCFEHKNLTESESKDVITEIGTYITLTEAFNDFSRLYIGAESFKQKKQGQLSNLQRQINQKLKLRNDLLKSLEYISHKRSYSQLGDIIMANIHSIPSGLDEIELFDFYKNSFLKVKLKPDLNPQQNGALYYRKAKNEVKGLEFKQKALLEVNIQISNLEKQFLKLEETNDAKGLRTFDKASVSKTKVQHQALPYKCYHIGGFEILVGKNAKSNDELLSKYASKNDLWLHAKDVSGSHTIIKNPSSRVIPTNVLEEVASLAAWYSKAKSNPLAPVIYTLRKFVRKPKGAAAGLVIIEKEKSLLVEPKDFKG